MMTKPKRYAVEIDAAGAVVVCEQQTQCPDDAPDPDVYPGQGLVPTWVNLWAVDEERARYWALMVWRVAVVESALREAMDCGNLRQECEACGACGWAEKVEEMLK